MRPSQGLLDQDNVPNENQSLTCFSCDEPMTGLYCRACGNKNDNYRRSVWSLGLELFQNLTAFEGRMWRSLISLISRPGRMARQYADGARQKWTSPIRLFLATSLLLFGYIAVSGTQIVALGDIVQNDRPSEAGIRIDAQDGQYNQRLLWFVRQSHMKTPPLERLNAAREGLDFNFNPGEERTAESLRESIADLDQQILDANSEIAIGALKTTRDALQNDLDTIQLEKLNAEIQDPVENAESGDLLRFNGLNGETITLDNAGMSELYVRILENPAVINNQLNTQLKWAMFFMMPFAMFMGAIFIRGRKTAMLYDHLVHAAYVHAFSFLLLFCFILLAQYTSAPGLVGWYTLILLIYLPISVKHAFQRGWFKSVLTAYGVGFVYTLIVIILSILIVGSALATIASEISHTNRPETLIEGS